MSNKKTNEIIVLGRVLPKSGKIHQKQEVYHYKGIISTITASICRQSYMVLVKK